MIGRIAFLGVTIAVLAATASAADVRELARDEIRQNVRTGQTLSLQRLLSVVSQRIQGDMVDVRAFDAGGIYYRVLVKRPNGQLAALVIDARTGALASGNSAVGREIMAASKSSRGVDNGNSRNNANRGENGNGNGNRGGNGGRNGNGGGNGNSGGGGNGGGNSGGGKGKGK